jgi:hypothetical protein
MKTRKTLSHTLLMSQLLAQVPSLTLYLALCPCLSLHGGCTCGSGHQRERESGAGGLTREVKRERPLP